MPRTNKSMIKEEERKFCISCKEEIIPGKHVFVTDKQGNHYHYNPCWKSEYENYCDDFGFDRDDDQEGEI